MRMDFETAIQTYGAYALEAALVAGVAASATKAKGYILRAAFGTGLGLVGAHWALAAGWEEPRVVLVTLLTAAFGEPILIGLRQYLDRATPADLAAQAKKWLVKSLGGKIS